MFYCERCGSRYSAMHAATIENCPRCLVRDRTAAQLAFKAFETPARPGAVSSRAVGKRVEAAGGRSHSL